MVSGVPNIGVDEYCDDEKARLAHYWDAGHGRAPLVLEHEHEHEHEHELGITQRNHKRIRRIHHFLFLTVLFILGSLFWRPRFHWSQRGVHGGDHAQAICELGKNNYHPSSNLVFDWADLKPSKGFNWTECYGSYFCARLAVPLDYADPSGEEAAVAVIKSPSRYQPGDKHYKGPILFNPGGPGGSGVVTVLGATPAFRKILGEEFDFIGFDPRGVGLTTPSLGVFETTQEAGAFFMQVPASMNTSISALGEVYAHGDVLATLVEDRARHVAEYVSTPTVARDMLSIINAEGYEKLQYWGFSYGTVLGATFAAMFPDKVQRIVIDGVVDSENYNAGKWSNNLRDTDAALMDIYQSCVNAGPEKCAIYENSTSLIQQRVERLLNKLKTAPLPLYVSTPEGTTYDVVGHDLVKGAMFLVLYTTHGGGGKYLTDALAELEKGNPRLIHIFSQKRIFDSLLTCNCPAPGERARPVPGFLEVTLSIACGDAEESEESMEDLREAYEEMSKDSIFADIWTIRLACSRWQVQAKDRFKGSYKHSTSHPLLLIGNVADPVTPLWNAHKMSDGFKDSVVLTQNSSGHCSVSAVSLCTMKAIRSYFLNGTLPEKGTVCQTESSIFEYELATDVKSLSSEDQGILGGLQDLQNFYFVPLLGSGIRLPALSALIRNY